MKYLHSEAFDRIITAFGLTWGCYFVVFFILLLFLSKDHSKPIWKTHDVVSKQLAVLTGVLLLIALIYSIIVLMEWVIEKVF